MKRPGTLSALLAAALSCAGVCALYAQQLPVDMDDRVYSVLEIADIRGLVPPGSAVRPYSEREVQSRLEAAGAAGGQGLSSAERGVVEDLAARFLPGDAPAAFFLPAGVSSVRVDLSRPDALDFSAMGDARVAGTLWSVLSYGLSVEGFVDMVNPAAFAPYDFSRQTDGFQVWTEGQSVQLSQGVNGHLNFGSAAFSALSLDLFDHALNLQFTRTRRDWGVGEGSLSLAGTARPVEAFSASVVPVPWAEFHFLAGTLGDWWNPAAEQKMFSIHRLELFPTDWLYLSPWESVVYAKRLELSYLDPLMPFFFGQQLGGDYDNVAMGADAAVTIAHVARLYVSLFVDEISFPPLSTFFTRPNNQYAWQAGVKVPLPWPAWSLFVFQYTRIEPYTYTHYPQVVPPFTQPIDTSYTNDGENLGYHLPPNSDEFLVRLSASPLPALSVSLQYQLIRHGTGDHLLGQIEGDINKPIIYSPPTTYPLKDFLHDGIYEWITIARLDASYSVRALNATLWAEYAFVAASASGNVPGNDVAKNLVGIGIRVAPPPPG